MTKSPCDLPVRSYQEICLPDGSKLAGNDRSYLHPFVFGVDFAGKTLLDVGTYHGHFCIEAMRRGASRAVGIDPCAESLEVARHIAAQLTPGPKYVHGDFETWLPDDRFNVVLLLNVLHHMWDPIHVLRKAAKIATDRIVLELHVPRERDLKRKATRLASFFGAPSAFNVDDPLIVLGQAEEAQHTFMLTPAAVATIFEKHFTCFEPVQISRSPFKGRSIVLAEKRKVENLTIVAGPTGSGTGDFIARLRSSEPLCQQYGIGGIDAVLNAGNCRDLPKRVLNHIVLEYDTMRPSVHALRLFSRDPVLTLTMAARSVTVLTLETARERIIRRFRTDHPNPTGLDAVIRDTYDRAGFLDRLHALWLSHVDVMRVARHQIVEA